MQRDRRCKRRGQDREYFLGLWFWVMRTCSGDLKVLVEPGRYGVLACLRLRRLFPAAAPFFPVCQRGFIHGLGGLAQPAAPARR